jgi:hypothetical protein
MQLKRDKRILTSIWHLATSGKGSAAASGTGFKLPQMFLAAKEVASHLLFFVLNLIVVHFGPYSNCQKCDDEGVEVANNATYETKEDIRYGRSPNAHLW